MGTRMLVPMSSLAERVRTARIDAGLSQVEAASRAEIGLSALRNIEQGITDDPRVSTVRQLERALGAQLFIHEPQSTTDSNGCGKGPETSKTPTDASQRSPVGA